jgi:hypothetical protein
MVAASFTEAHPLYASAPCECDFELCVLRCVVDACPGINMQRARSIPPEH